MQLLRSQGPWWFQVCQEAPAATSAVDMALFGIFSNVWQLVLKQRPWLVLLYCSMQQAFKEPSLLVFIAQLLAPACGVRESTVMAPLLHMTQQQCPATMAIWLSFKDIFHKDFFPPILSGCLSKITSNPCPNSSQSSAPKAPSHQAFWWTCVPVQSTQGHGTVCPCGSHSI